jgi:Orn/Lys/Arg decarboxylase, major domain
VVERCSYDGTIIRAELILEKLGPLCDYLVFDEAWAGFTKFHPIYKGRKPDDSCCLARRHRRGCPHDTFAHDDAAVCLPFPLSVLDEMEARALIPANQVVSPLRRIESQFVRAMADGKALGFAQQERADAPALLVWVHSELPDRRCARPIVPWAPARSTRRVEHDSAQENARVDCNEAIAPGDTFEGDFLGLVYGCVVEAHLSKAGVCGVQQIRQSRNGIAGREVANYHAATPLRDMSDRIRMIVNSAWRSYSCGEGNEDERY